MKLTSYFYSSPNYTLLAFFIDNPSGRTMALGSTQPLIEMSKKNITWRVRAAGA
jgi:hypothetical protein